jgi:F-type H+-transporting ATPase subunit b
MNALAVFAAEAGAENGAWFPHDMREVLWGSLAFLIVFGLLWKFAKKPGSDYFTKRTADIAESLDAAASARAEAEAERDQIKSALADADSEKSRIIEEGRRSADALTADIAARADRDVAAVQERAAVDLAATRTQIEALEARDGSGRASGVRGTRRREPAAPDRQLHQRRREPELTSGVRPGPTSPVPSNHSNPS